MNTTIFNEILNLMKESITSPQSENLKEKLNPLMDKLRDYCSNNNLLGGYRLIRLLEFEFESLSKQYGTEKRLPQLTIEISNMLKVEKEILVYKIKHPELIKKDDTYTDPPVHLQWTDTKIALVELAYSLTRSINNGKVTIAQLAKGLGYLFNVHISLNSYYVYLNQINTREKPAKYLHTLIDNLKAELDRINSK